MSFFYSSPAGAADLAALVFVAGVAFWFGQGRARTFAAAMVAVFLSHRGLMTMDGLNAMMAWGGLVDFAAVLAMLYLVPSIWGRAMAALFSIKIALYLFVVGGILDFDAMATGAAVLVWFQFLLILAAVPHDGFWRRIRGDGTAGPAHNRVRGALPRRVSGR